MRYQNIYVLKRGWLFLITIFYSSLIFGQPYTGGSNSGSAASNTAAINCTASRYFGGDNDGTATVAATIIDCTGPRFFGDIEDGNSAAQTNISDCTPVRFWGDTADGVTAIATNLRPCTDQRFQGDTAGGYASAKYLLIRDFLGNDTTAIIVCSESTFNLLTLYTTPANLTYNWSSLTPAASGLGVYTLIATNQSGCTDTAQATLQQEIAIWNGSVSNNWHTATNWNNGKIPSEVTHVIIPDGTVNPCQVKDTDAFAASVQAKSGGSFSIINNRLLLISGTCVQLPTGP